MGRRERASDVAEVRERWEIGGGRGDPDAILQRIREEEEAGEAERFEGRGRLKVFFGYAAGVGKTFAMLAEAHRVQDEGVDVVVGYVEPHTRTDTLALLDGLEVLPVKSVKHRNVALREFDLDATLKRRPQVVLVDELAHTNAPGCRHRKRYQDVEELLRAGIDVYTTVNVQHLEGLNDKIASVTAVAPSERIPDRVFDAADSVEVVDLEPADLIKRLRSGKIYAPERIGSALSHFFSRSNLAALREIALRRAADRLTRASAATVPHAAGGEDVLVLVTADAAAPRVIRAAAGMAEAFGGSCTALVVESGGEGAEGRSKGDAALARSIALAEEMGAHIVTLTGDDPVQPVALYAAAAGIRRIVVPSMPGRIGLLGCGDVASRLMRAAPEAMVTAVPAVDAPLGARAFAHLRELSPHGLRCFSSASRDSRCDGAGGSGVAGKPYALDHPHDLSAGRAAARHACGWFSVCRACGAGQCRGLQLLLHGAALHLPCL